MGLTIHWTLKAPKGATGQDISEILTALRAHALKLNVAEVSEVLKFEGQEADYRKSPSEDEFKWLKTQAQKIPPLTDLDKGQLIKIRIPTKIYAVSIWPGEGCEEANFGFAQYEGVAGWHWQSFCKTQYANEHGIEHFLKCHLAVVYLLDVLKAQGCLKKVSDEGDYWKSRKVDTLVKKIGEWDAFVAACAGALKDSKKLGVINAPILKRPDFEQLEFRGLQALESSQKKKRIDENQAKTPSATQTKKSSSTQKKAI